MSAQISILNAQINLTVGAILENTQKIITIIKQNQMDNDVIVFPELAITGYPPEDLLLRPNLYMLVDLALAEIQKRTEHCYVIVGHPKKINEKCYNAASIFHHKKLISFYCKQALPNYGVFDEQRYFVPGEPKPCILSIKNYRFAVCICEDLWVEAPVQRLIGAKVDFVFCLNASPFDYNKPKRREDLLKSLAKKGLATIYVNQVGGQDELVFDGQSLAVDYQGKVCARANAFREDLQKIIIKDHKLVGEVNPLLDLAPLIYQALICGTRDYIKKNGFTKVLLGLSGGIDSALTLAIAVDALGSDNVQAVLMPSRFTAKISSEDAMLQLQTLNVSHTTISIEPAFMALTESLAPSFAGLPTDQTEENIQARIRAIILMALANKAKKLVLTTSNKSEVAVGYTTLYGDMAGAFAVLKDVLKTQVYMLARYRNSISKEAIIPERVLLRAPSAELKENQTDQDNLPDYEMIDAVIKGYVENNKSVEELIKQGLCESDVKKIIRLITLNEYKRRQAPPGIKISPCAFGKDWRWPLNSKFE